MQIFSLNQQIEFNSQNAKPAEKADSVKVEIQRDLPTESNSGQQSEKLNELKNILSEHNISLNFTRDEETDQLVVKLVNSQTGEAIRQTPSEVSLKLAALYARVQGQFLDKRV